MAKKISHTLGWLLIKCRIKKLLYFRMTADFVCSANVPNFLPNEVSYTCLLIRCNPNKKPHACPKKQQIFQGKIVFYNNWKANTNYIDTFLTLCNIFFYGQPLSVFIFCQIFVSFATILSVFFFFFFRKTLIFFTSLF